MVFAHFLAGLVGFFVDLEEHDIVWGKVAKGIPLVLTLPVSRKMGHGGVVFHQRVEYGDLLGGVTGEKTTDHVGVPRPVFFGCAGVRGGMDTDVSSAVFHPSLEGGTTHRGDLGSGFLHFLGRILRDDIAHDISRHAHEGDRAILGEVFSGEDGRVFGHIDFEAGGLELLFQHFVAYLD